MQTFKRFMVAGGFGVTLLVVALTGCETSRWGHKSDERTPGQRVDDHQLTAEVKKRLHEEPVYKFDDVGVRTFDGTVQLSGFVNSEQQKQRAGQVAQEVPGVARILNSIALKPAIGPAPTGRTNSVYQSTPPPSTQQ